MTVEEFAREQVAPVIGEFYEQEEVPLRPGRADGGWGCSVCRSRRSTAAWAGDYFGWPRVEELARVDSSVAIP